jgi:hypothetical protein
MKAGTTRRGFLKRSSRLVTAGLVAPTIVRSGALKAEGRPAANERVGVGFIGVGGRGANLLGHYAENAQFPCVAVCDVDQELREKAAKRLGPEAGKHNDYRELLDRKDVDAVVIAVPDHWHAITAIQSCEAGKDVYCEKPLSLTVRQGRAMVDAARRYGSVFQTGSQQRSQSNFREACELVRSGRLGKIESIRVSVWGPPNPFHQGSTGTSGSAPPPGGRSITTSIPLIGAVGVNTPAARRPIGEPTISTSSSGHSAWMTAVP